jgi:anionic cell wall polymer biosynthesis LytR-Cps2A-Psr (LCP) family protein
MGKDKIKKIKHKRKKINKYRIRKIFFWLVLILSFIIGFLCFFKYSKKPVAVRFIRAGICGAIKQPAVYNLREGSDLSMLIRLAKGFTFDADVSKIDLDLIIKHDSIYHIPEGTTDNRRAFYQDSIIYELNQQTSQIFNNISKEISDELSEKEIKHHSILYIGLPAVFVLIDYYPEYSRINFTHIPHSTVFLHNEYRISDIFFIYDIYPTMRLLENKLKQKIDYYLIQDRFLFIDMIDVLGGVDIKLDKPYADSYHLQPMKQRLDGFHAWEYIRFLDWRNFKMDFSSGRDMNLITHDNFKANASEWERIYEERNQRQRYVLQGMRKSFISLSSSEQLRVLSEFSEIFQTDMTKEFLFELYKDILQTPHFSFGSIPGYYVHQKEKLFFYPDLPDFEMLRKQMIRTYLEKRQDKSQTIY